LGSPKLMGCSWSCWKPLGRGGARGGVIVHKARCIAFQPTEQSLFDITHLVLHIIYRIKEWV